MSEVEGTRRERLNWRWEDGVFEWLGTEHAGGCKACTG